METKRVILWRRKERPKRLKKSFFEKRGSRESHLIKSKTSRRRRGRPGVFSTTPDLRGELRKGRKR